MKEADPAARQVVPSAERVTSRAPWASSIARAWIEKSRRARSSSIEAPPSTTGSAPGCAYVSRRVAATSSLPPPGSSSVAVAESRVRPWRARRASPRALPANAAASPSTRGPRRAPAGRRRRSRTAPPTSQRALAPLAARAAPAARDGAPRRRAAETPADGALEDVLDRPLPRQGLDLARQTRRGRDAHRVGGLQRGLELPGPDRAGSRRASCPGAGAGAPGAASSTFSSA